MKTMDSMMAKMNRIQKTVAREVANQIIGIHYKWTVINVVGTVLATGMAVEKMTRSELVVRNIPPHGKAERIITEDYYETQEGPYRGCDFERWVGPFDWGTSMSKGKADQAYKVIVTW